MNILSIRRKILLGLGAISTITVILALIVYVQFYRVGAALQDSYAWPDRSLSIHELYADIVETHEADMMYAFATDQAERTALDRKRTEAGSKVKSVLNIIKRESASAAEESALNDLISAWDGYDRAAIQYHRVWESGDVAAASALIKGEMSSAMERIMSDVNEMMRRTTERAIATNEDGELFYVWAIRFFGILIAVFVVISIILTIITLASVMRSIRKFATSIGAPSFEALAALEMGTDEGTVHRLVGQIHDSAVLLAKSTEDLEKSAEISEEDTRVIDRSIEHVSEEANKQYVDLEHAVAQLEDMSRSLTDAVETLEATSQDALEALDRAREGELSMQRVVKQMSLIEQTSSASASVVSSLGARSHEIGQIVGTISRIASQTNLLALNAAIEAARAGEHGRGFSVVAEQVKKLAGESQLAAEEIGKLIEAIQTETGEAVHAMEEGNTEVRTGAEAIDESGRAFSLLALMMAGNSDKLKGVVSMMHDLVSSSSKLLNSLRDVEGESRAISEDSRLIVKATEDQAKSMTNISSESKTLEMISHDMQSVAERFEARGKRR